MKFGFWLQEKMKQQGLSQKDLAVKTGVSQSAISRWLHNLRNPDPPHLRKILPLLQVSEQEGFMAAGLLEKPIQIDQDNSITIPFLSPQIPCGEPIEVLDQYVMEYKKIPRDMFQSILGSSLQSDNVYMVRAIGDSMTGKGIYPGDWVLFASDLQVKNGDIAIVFVEDIGLCMKELLIQDQILILQSANPSYNPIVIPNKQDVRIIGKVLMKMGKI